MNGRGFRGRNDTGRALVLVQHSPCQLHAGTQLAPRIIHANAFLARFLLRHAALPVLVSSLSRCLDAVPC
jgi:hypothetical protein